MRRRRPRALEAMASALIATVLPGCSTGEGVVELNWAFVDREGAPVYPGGQFALNRYESSCGLPGDLAGADMRYDLHVELEICDPDCAGGCEDAACRIVEPIRFPCNTARGSEAIPSSPDPYLFTVSGIIELDDGTICDTLPQSCVAVPGPRQRTVGDGRLTDLQVYQLGIEMDGTAAKSSDAAKLDLEACNCGIAP